MRGLQHGHPTFAQRRDVRTRGRVVPHLGVHRRRDDDGAGGDEAGCGEQIVRSARCEPCQQIRGGGGDDDEVGLLTDADMLHLIDAVEYIGRYRVSRQSLERRGTDEVQRGSGRNDPNGISAFGEPPDDVARLVGGDATGDTEHDVPGTPGVPAVSGRWGVSGRIAGHGILQSSVGTETVAQRRQDPFPSGMPKHYRRWARGVRRRGKGTCMWDGECVGIDSEGLSLLRGRAIRG